MQDKDQAEKSTSRCARCGDAFACGMEGSAGGCWCADLPALERLPEGYDGCLCPHCLREMLAHAQITSGC